MACKNDGCKCLKDRAEKTTLASGIPLLQIIPLENMFKLPEYAHPGDAGMDVYSAQHAGVEFGKVTKIQTGISFNIPDGYELQVRSRSGLASKGIVVANSPGTIDSGYRGEVCVLLTNLNGLDSDRRPNYFVIKPGDRIAQLVFAKVENFVMMVGDKIEPSFRGAGGFGSTGV